MRATYASLADALGAIAAHVGALVHLAERETYPADHLSLTVIRSTPSGRIVATMRTATDTSGADSYTVMPCLPRGIH